MVVKGVEGLCSFGFGGILLMFSFVVLFVFINFFMGSASVKWVIMVSVFVFMFMLFGYILELI